LSNYQIATNPSFYDDYLYVKKYYKPIKSGYWLFNYGNFNVRKYYKNGCEKTVDRKLRKINSIPSNGNMIIETIE